MSLSVEDRSVKMLANFTRGLFRGQRGWVRDSVEWGGGRAVTTVTRGPDRFELQALHLGANDISWIAANLRRASAASLRMSVIRDGRSGTLLLEKAPYPGFAGNSLLAVFQNTLPQQRPTALSLTNEAAGALGLARHGEGPFEFGPRLPLTVRSARIVPAGEGALKLLGEGSFAEKLLEEGLEVGIPRAPTEFRSGGAQYLVVAFRRCANDLYVTARGVALFSYTGRNLLASLGISALSLGLIFFTPDSFGDA